MAHDDSILEKLKLNARELESRRAFFEITDADLTRLSALRPLAEVHADRVVEELYQLILGHEGTRAFFPDDGTVRRVKTMQRRYFLGLFSGVCDLRYMEDRLRVGTAHERIGLSPKWYLGAYARYLRILLPRILGEGTDTAAGCAAYASLEKLVFFDMSLAIDTYILQNLETIGRHQAAIRELSTPVIRVYERVLLLPLVGTLDSFRAQQVMETVLTRVVEEQAKVVIVDIAGVPVVDTRVADYLLKTTAAVRLLGAVTVLTGISAQVARTVVQLGVDISSMYTRSQLAEGIEVALDVIGKQITALEKDGTPRRARRKRRDAGEQA